jgi:RES domain-containing protein
VRGDVDPDLVPNDLAAFELEIPDTLAAATVEVSVLPADWREPEHPYCKALGDAWIGEGRVPLLRVPSVIIPQELNVLINPSHPDAARIAVVDQTEFVFDLRLLR